MPQAAHGSRACPPVNLAWVIAGLHHRVGGPRSVTFAHRLETVDAATKLLIVISDGRPFDIDYGQQYGDEAILAYAVGDTAKALDEARTAGLHPYLITVDPDGDRPARGAGGVVRRRARGREGREIHPASAVLTRRA